MAAMDKLNLRCELLALGWIAAEEDATDGDIPIQYQVIPPDELWTNRPKTFYVYNAKQLQNLLGDALPEDED